MHDNDLLTLATPEYRKAYSDRTAWIMACLSELVYIRFEPLIKEGFDEQRIIERLNEMLDKPKTASMIKLLKTVCYDSEENLKTLIAQLSNLTFCVKEKFNHKGTQAILVSNDNMLVLAFRGTEADRVSDIKADMKALQKPCSTDGRIHSGFSEAYEVIEPLIIQALSKDEYKERPLYITGHSLGGALATVATKRLHHTGGHAATYTFGSPRVGNEDWVSSLKTPVYRIVNSADIVTMLPPGGTTTDVLGWGLKAIPVYGEVISKWLLDNFSGYMHGGNMRYLSNCKKGDYGQVKLLYSVHIWRRVRAMFNRMAGWSKLLSDHSISVYRQKLLAVARRRNNLI